MVVGSTCFETQRGTAPCWNPRCEAVLYQNRFQKSLTIWMLQMRISNKKHASCIFNRKLFQPDSPFSHLSGHLKSRRKRLGDVEGFSMPGLAVGHWCSTWGLSVAVAGRRGSEESPSTNTSSFTVSPTFLKTCFFFWKRNEWEAGRNESLGSFPTLQRFKKKVGFHTCEKVHVSKWKNIFSSTVTFPTKIDPYWRLVGGCFRTDFF